MRDVKSDNVQTWLELLRGFDQARGHFAESYRHALLGGAETVRVVQQLAADPRSEAYGGTELAPYLDLVRKGLAMWADKIPSFLEASNFDMAKREALITVKEVLQAELMRIEERDQKSDEDRIKVDALEAIMRVVDMELDRRESKQPEPSTLIRRVVIE